MLVSNCLPLPQDLNDQNFGKVVNFCHLLELEEVGVVGDNALEAF